MDEPMNRTLRMRMDFEEDGYYPWFYSMALNGRHVRRLTLDGEEWGPVDRLKSLNGELCAEVNEKDRRIRALESACLALMGAVERGMDGAETERAWALVESLGLDKRYMRGES